MSEENVEVVRKALDAANAFLRGELTSEAAVELTDPKVEWRWHDERTFPDEPQLLRGAPAVIGFWDEMRNTWVDLVLEPLEFIEAPDDRVLTPLRQGGRGREVVYRSQSTLLFSGQSEMGT